MAWLAARRVHPTRQQLLSFRAASRPSGAVYLVAEQRLLSPVEKLLLMGFRVDHHDWGANSWEARPCLRLVIVPVVLAHCVSISSSQQGLSQLQL